MDRVVSGVFLILESGLRNDGKRKLRQVVSHLERRQEQVSPEPLFPLCQHLQVPGSTRQCQRARGGGPRGGEEPP